MWMLSLIGLLHAHEGHDHDGTAGVGLAMLPEALCQAQWPSMDDAPEQISRRCNTYFIPFAYPDGFDRTQPPSYGHPIELQLTIAGLQQILVHMQDTCHTDEPVEDAACFRAHEFYRGLLDRKLAVTDNGAWFDIPLEKVLAGQRLSEADLRGWSALTLRKLEHAVYARHGKDFDDPDLDAFFYGEREKPVAGLPLTMTAPEAIQLTDTDQDNLERIQTAQSQKGEKKKSYGL